jgi:AcrR family transcriptional regulator
MKNDRKKEIISAAKKLFALNGYSPTSMDDIARDVGITKASLYYFFESKERIFTDIIEEVAAEIKNYLAAELKICEEQSESLADMIDRIISICLKNGIVIRPIDIKMANIQPIIFEKILPTLAEVKKVLRQTLACHGVAESKLAAEVLVNSTHAYVLQRKHGIKIAPQKEYSRYLASLFGKNQKI